MSRPLSRLVYYSRNRVEGGPQHLTDTIASILAKSRVNNQLVGVTGALMFNAGCFAQVLEGGRDAVEAVFERIQQDERHDSVILLELSEIDERRFPNWSMGYVGASPADAARFKEVSATSGFEPSRMSGEEILEALHRLAMEEENAL